MIMENTMVMGRKLVVTTNLSAFENMPNVNSCNGDYGYCFKLFDAKIPTNLVLGKTYYTIYEGDLIAFKIRAYSYTQHFVKSTLWCFVENAIGDLYWSNAILTNKIFESVEDYYNYLASGKGNVKIEYAYFTNLNDGKGFCLKNTYYWHKEKQRPQATETNIYYILVDENNVYVGVDYTHKQYGKVEQGFTSGEECIKANVNGMKIIEFAEPKVSFSFHIEEPKEPKVRVLKFID